MHLPQNGTISFEPQPCFSFSDSNLGRSRPSSRARFRCCRSSLSVADILGGAEGTEWELPRWDTSFWFRPLGKKTHNSSSDKFLLKPANYMFKQMEGYPVSRNGTKSISPWVITFASIFGADEHPCATQGYRGFDPQPFLPAFCALPSDRTVVRLNGSLARQLRRPLPCDVMY